MGFYTLALQSALENSTTLDNIRLMYTKCITYFPGDFVHRVLLYENGTTEYHRIMKGSTELASVRKGEAVVILQSLEFNKEMVSSTDGFIETNATSAIDQLRKMSNVKKIVY
ncbi:hypothetical protein D3C81_1130540 [compost metagenome]